MELCCRNSARNGADKAAGPFDAGYEDSCHCHVSHGSCGWRPSVEFTFLWVWDAAQQIPALTFFFSSFFSSLFLKIISPRFVELRV